MNTIMHLHVMHIVTQGATLKKQSTKNAAAPSISDYVMQA